MQYLQPHLIPCEFVQNLKLRHSTLIQVHIERQQSMSSMIGFKRKLNIEFIPSTQLHTIEYLKFFEKSSVAHVNLLEIVHQFPNFIWTMIDKL